MFDSYASTSPDSLLGNLGAAAKRQLVWLLSAAIILALLIWVPDQGRATLNLVASSLTETGPFLILSILLSAYATASGADALIARAFAGSPAVMIVMAALVGALSPFCSCGVIPLVAALLGAGVPVSAVMAFWLASPVMDPSMFMLTAGVMGWQFAIAKTLAAIGLGLLGGGVTFAAERAGLLSSPLRKTSGCGGCCSSRKKGPEAEPVAWAFWQDSDRKQMFRRRFVETTVFLLKWLTLAFVLESLMIAYVPGELVARTLGGDGIGVIGMSALVGVPAYLNGYAALPLVHGLMEQGMAGGAALAFLVAGGASSLPAAIAVWALVRPPVFLLYIGLALSGSFLAGLLFQGWLS
ncbi:permease [Cohaesibacter haloalkalitolerans]|uniref:permease n=1 Tax=Cohaesibacter haloalkalitolerans TaxID=1162980 RepID=UPI000E64B96B|nr:permease [Cohaesibacter haloalkalitolerans]